MNILVVAPYQNDGSPTAIFIHDQIKAYQELGHHVRAIVPIPIGKKYPQGQRIEFGVCREAIDGVDHVFLRYVSLSNFGNNWWNLPSAKMATWPWLNEILKDFSPDIIHAHTIGFGGDLGSLLKKRLCVPLVVTTHGSDASILVEQGKNAELKRYCDKADAIAAVSSVLAEKIQSCGTDIPISVILNGFRAENLLTRKAERGCSLIQVGRLQRQKCFHITLQAFARLREDHPEAVLTLIGEGPARNSLEAQCQKLGVSPAVCFLGQIPNPAVLSEMAKSRFFVLPSVREGFGIVYLEAMASGCVTIGTEGEGISDLIASGENGFLVPPDDPEAIAEVLSWCMEHPEKADQIAERGHRSAIDLTWEKNAAQYIELFQQLKACEQA